MKITVRDSVGSWRNGTGLPFIAYTNDAKPHLECNPPEHRSAIGGRRSLAVERLLHQLEAAGEMPEVITIENLDLEGTK